MRSELQSGSVQRRGWCMAGAGAMARCGLALLVLGAGAVPALAQGSRAARSERLWQNNCMKCHGEMGEGGGAGTKSLLTDELMAAKYDRLFFDTIKRGKADLGMEPFGETLEDREIWALVNYIRELQAGARRERVGSISKKLDNAGVCATQHERFTIQTVIEKGLGRTPWAIDWLPKGDSQPQRMLVTTRDGKLLVWQAPSPNAKGQGTLLEVQDIPESVEAGQGGMMEVAVHPDAKAMGEGVDGFVYLGYTQALDGSRTMTNIARGRLVREANGWAWRDNQVLWQAKQEHAIASGLHFGVRLVFGATNADQGKRHLFFGIGDRGQADHAQDLQRPNGKVHRIFDDGSIPEDNPFVDRSNAYASIWSFGHRNPQGLVMDLSGNLWDTEHGPRGGDELNLILSGRNYGWPLVSFGINYNGAPFKTPWADVEGGAATNGAIMMPTDRWLPSIGACGMDVVRPGPQGEAFPGWKGDILAGGLSGENVDRIRIVADTSDPSGFRVAEREEIVHGLGRVRDVAVAPDGSVYVVLNDPGRVVRLAPLAK